MGVFHFKRFDVRNEKSAMKVNTDGVLLGVVMDPSGKELLDIGTGTGTIALIAAQRNPEARITAVDIDAASAEEADANFGASPWGGRLAAIHSSLQDYARGEHPRFDLVFSNPPYFDNPLTNPAKRKSGARHTADLSYREIFAFCEGSLHGQSSPGLAENGRIALVLPAEEEKRLMREARSRGFIPFRITRICTTPRKAPKRLIAEFVRSASTSNAAATVSASTGIAGTAAACQERCLTLESEGRRTPEYIELTKDFYLN